MARKTGGQIFSRANVLSLLFALGVTIASAFLFSRVEVLRHLGYIGVFFISLLSSATVFLPLPGFAVVFAMGRYLNPVLLGIAAGIGSGIGEATGYFVGFAGHNIVESTKIFLEHKKQIEKYGAPAIFVLAFLPNPAFDIAGIAAGAIEMPVWKFLLATILGKTLRFILIAYIGGYTAAWLA